MSSVRLGVVLEYDRERGLGVVREHGREPGLGAVREHEGRREGAVGDGAGGAREYAFHCTAITDGTREVEPGASVAFVVGPGHGGAFQATEVTKLDRSGLADEPAV